ncbi:MAG: 3-demethylubiquinone-9 3-methyltransferase [Microgenomates bacterium OLB22]|nr:MAG: 3-demethylubiquinone-9 3-methyltransferase [Microgenomates bacterium OLB22]
MQKITPFLWFDKEAREAATLYISLFPDSKIKSTTVMNNTPSGTVEILSIELAGLEVGLMSAGPYFRFTPAISFTVACNTKDEAQTLWDELSKGGMALMELGEYPFSEKFGWIQDKFGLSWQIMYVGDSPVNQKITPSLMFVGEQFGKAEKAMSFYKSVFHDSEIIDIMRYGNGDGEPEEEGMIKHARFTLEGLQMSAMDSSLDHEFSFNEAFSFVVNCTNQEEIDYYWEKLSADPDSEQCGWLKDAYGVSWQINPIALDEMLKDPDQEKRDRVTQAVLKMKKLDIRQLEKAYNGK